VLTMHWNTSFLDAMSSTCGTVKLHIGGPHAWVYWLSVGKVESLDIFYAVLSGCVD
jgi:hypothetical protein